MRPLLLLSLFLLAIPAGATSPLDDPRDGTVTFTFPTVRGVWGDGSGSIMSGNVEEWRGDSQEGPGRILVTFEDGHVERAEFTVGRARARHRDARDAGHLSAEEARPVLRKLARGDEEIVAALGVLDDPAVWADLVTLAEDRDRPRDVREQARFWLGQHARWRVEEQHEGFRDPDPDGTEVKQAAVFALSQTDTPEARERLLAVARDHSNPEVRAQAMFWLTQMDEDPRVIDLFAEVLEGR
jgi:hypothetical protein